MINVYCIKIGIVLRNKYIFILACFLLVGMHLSAADWWPVAMHKSDVGGDTIGYAAEISAVASLGAGSPFWMQALESGNISSDSYSGNITFAVYKKATRPSRWYDYDFGLALTGRFDTEYIVGYFRSLYAHIRLYVVDITAGIKPLIVGSQNPQLTTGGLMFSGNAYPIPRVSIGLDKYVPFPGLYGYLEVTGGLTHGWFVDNSLLDPSVHTTNALLHYKFAGIRVGGSLPINIGYELHHVGQWGGISPYYGKFSTSWDTYKHIFLAQGGGNNLSDQLNAEGNHIGMQELSIVAKWTHWNIIAYWQTIFEDKSANFIGRTNQQDGLWGIALQQNEWPFLNAVTVEFLNTTRQDGPWHDRDGQVYGGRSGYYYNSSYKQGWTHFGHTIGNSMMTPDNNRVRVCFVGASGDIYGFKYRIITSHARNWGTYDNPNYSTNTACMLEVKKQVGKAWGLDFGLRMAADIGTQYGNRFGAMITISKQGIIHSY